MLNDFFGRIDDFLDAFFSPTQKAMVFSFLRVLAATAVAAFLALGKKFSELELADLTAIGDAVLAAAGLTLVNYLRPGERRFGVHAEPEGFEESEE